MLPLKTVLEVNRKGHTCTLKAKAKAPSKNKARAYSIEVKETEDDNSPGNTTQNVSFNPSIISISPKLFH